MPQAVGKTAVSNKFERLLTLFATDFLKEILSRSSSAGVQAEGLLPEGVIQKKSEPRLLAEAEK